MTPDKSKEKKALGWFTPLEAELLGACKTTLKDINTALLYKRINKSVAEDISSTLEQAIAKAEGR